MLTRHLRRFPPIGLAATCCSRRFQSSDPVTAPQKQQQQQPKPKRAEKSGALSSSSALVPRAPIPDAYQSFSDCIDARAVKGTYSALPEGARDEAAFIRVAGRVVAIRDMGKVVFITIATDGVHLQVAANVSETFTKDALAQLKKSIRAGDIIGVEGTPGRSKKGEVTVFLRNYRVLAPYVCTDIVTCPDQNGHGVIADQDVKYRYRFLDMINNPSTNATFRMRFNVICALRDYLRGQQFVEVETPMFNTIASGAAARPFTTHHNALDYDLHLRVAPELYLKQCVVGGLDRVFEIGKVFRNEDCDRSHNPEFTSCELYVAYKTYRDLMPMTEEILRHLATAARGSTTITTVHPKTGKQVEIDFTKPFHRVSVVDEIERVSGVKLPPPAELDSPRGIAVMKSLLVREKVPIPSPPTASKLFDKLIDHFITDHVEQPTFVMDHPTFMSPLAKSHDAVPALSERFELFINGMEVCNSYSELNDPQEQLRRFEQQMRDREQGDDESMQLDETFLKALQVGLPPTAGWGMGMDRIVMILGGLTTIRDVILFPLLKPDDKSHDAKRRARTASFFDCNIPMTLFYLSTLEAELTRRGERVDHLANLKRHIVEMSQKGRTMEDLMRSFSPCGGGGKDVRAMSVDELKREYMKRSPLMCMLSCIVCGGFKW